MESKQLVARYVFGFFLALLAGLATHQSALAQSGAPSVYRGNYSCLQGTTPLELVLYGNGRGPISAEFRFTVPQTGQPGSFRLSGAIETDGRFKLMPVRWIQQPPGYFMVPLSGEVTADGREVSGMILAYGCRWFRAQLYANPANPAVFAAAPAPQPVPQAAASSIVKSNDAKAADATNAKPPAPATQASPVITLATMPGILVRELDDVNQSFNAYAIMGEMLGIPKMAKIDDAQGSWFLRNLDGSSGLYDFDVQNVKCRLVQGRSDQQICAYEVSALVEMNLPIVGLISQRTPFIARQDRFVVQRGRWTSPTLRAAMIEGLKTPPPSSSSANPAAGLCKSLAAGVVATGGSRDAVSLSQKAGC